MIAAAFHILFTSASDGSRNVPEERSGRGLEYQTTLPVYPEGSFERSEGLREETLIASRDWGYEDSEILLKIAMAEAEGESTEGKALVMLVVLNRVWTDSFPDNIEDVVFQKLNGAYQFPPAAPGGRYWTTEPDADCYKALDMVVHGWDESRGALYFEGNAGESWHSRNLNYLYTVGGHRFYK